MFPYLAIVQCNFIAISIFYHLAYSILEVLVSLIILIQGFPELHQLLQPISISFTVTLNAL